MPRTLVLAQHGAMTKIQAGSIVVAADGSAAADRAVMWAAEQAHLERRQLTVLTAARGTVRVLAGTGADAYGISPQELLDSARGVADAAAAAAAAHRPGLSVASVPALGEARDVLADISFLAHLIVLGSRGRGGFTSKVLGSVSASVVRHAACPVIVCRPGTEGKVHRGVVVGADGTVESLPVIEFAFEQASLRGLPLTILHSALELAVSVTGAPRVAVAGEPGYTDQMVLLSESVAGLRERFPEVHVTLQAARGLPADTLSVTADDYNLVVVGRHPVDSIGRRMSPALATEVLERCHTTVAVVPEDGGS